MQKEKKSSSIRLLLQWAGKEKILDVSGGHPILFQWNLYHDPLLRDLQPDECCLYRNLYHRIWLCGMLA